MRPTEFLESTKNRFHFDFLDHDPSLEKAANLKLLQLLALAPPKAVGVGMVEKQDRGYLSTVTIRSPFRSFTTQATATQADRAIQNALERMENELYRWRFGNGSGNYGEQNQGPLGSGSSRSLSVGDRRGFVTDHPLVL